MEKLREIEARLCQKSGVDASATALWDVAEDDTAAQRSLDQRDEEVKTQLSALSQLLNEEAMQDAIDADFVRALVAMHAHSQAADVPIHENGAHYVSFVRILLAFIKSPAIGEEESGK